MEFFGHVRVHPHASGEHMRARPRQCGCNGSSPREWGTLSSGGVAATINRFIPTRVGNTFFLRFAAIFAAVHPHASGEHGLRMIEGMFFPGSSPREWGTRDASGALAAVPRFIPTRVGNTINLRPRYTSSRVHPHASGEHIFVIMRCPLRVGSSPREWGTPSCIFSANGKNRFIPTRVGNTPAPGAYVPAPPVHPHASGEHTGEGEQGVGDVGSSPREWGTLLKLFLSSWVYRFIPTRVGNTDNCRAVII